MYLKAFFCFLTLLWLNLNSVEGREPKLLLHVDVNNTLIAIDTAKGITAEQSLNSLLAKKYTYKWTPELKEAISYEEYVKNYLFPGPSFLPFLKEKRTERLHHFVTFLQESSHPLEMEVVTVYQELLAKIETGVIFPSFLKMLEKLKEENISYTLILRTFGNDAPLIKEALQKVFPEDFFEAQGHFVGGKLSVATPGLSLVFLNPWEMYTFFKSLPSHLAIQDNWEEWRSHLGFRKYGKKFPLDRSDEEALSLFFDDNIHEDPHSLVNIVDPIDAKSGRQLNIKELLEQKVLFHVDTFEAIYNDDYFFSLVESALEAS